MSDQTIPASWTPVEIEDVLFPYPNGKKIRQGWSPQCENHPAESHDDWAVLRTSAIQDGSFVDAENKKLPPSLEPRTQLEVVAGDILMTCAGPRSRCGVTCLVRSTRPRLLISGKMYQLRADPEIVERHLLEMFLRESGTNKKIDEMKTGISDSGLNLTHDRFRTLPIPLPPLAEQKRIVAKIEELFSELEAGEASLRKARRQLGVYRQSLLKQAFEGKLTQKWRTQNPEKLESPASLLARIQSDRQSRYEQQFKDWEHAVRDWETMGATGRKPSKPSKSDTQIPALLPIGGDLRELPASWCWLALEHVVSSGPTNGYSPTSVSFPTPTKAVTLTATTSGRFDGSHYKYIDEIFPPTSDLWLRDGDVLIQRGNTIEYVGVPALYRGKSNLFIYPDLMMKIQAPQSVLPEYLTLAISEKRARNYMRGRAVGAAGSMPKINHAIIRALPLPLCSLPEQQEIVRLLDEQFEAIERNERELDAALQRSEALRQAILKKAFSGRLVPQDPADEPASALLARLRAERTTASATPPRRRRSISSASLS